MSKNVHRIEIAGVVRDLPIREVAPGVRVALFNILGDWELTEAAGKALAAWLAEVNDCGLTPENRGKSRGQSEIAGIEALVMPDGKATALLHVMGRETGLPTIVARKEKKPYMLDPVLVHEYRSITTGRTQMLCLSGDDVGKLRGKCVAIVDDVVSSGGTLGAMEALLAQAGAPVGYVMAVLTEGKPRTDIVSLGHLPLF